MSSLDKSSDEVSATDSSVPVLSTATVDNSSAADCVAETDRGVEPEASAVVEAPKETVKVATNLESGTNREVEESEEAVAESSLSEIIEDAVKPEAALIAESSAEVQKLETGTTSESFEEVMQPEVALMVEPSKDEETLEAETDALKPSEGEMVEETSKDGLEAGTSIEEESSKDVQEVETPTLGTVEADHSSMHVNVCDSSETNVSADIEEVGAKTEIKTDKDCAQISTAIQAKKAKEDTTVECDVSGIKVEGAESTLECDSTKIEVDAAEVDDTGCKVEKAENEISEAVNPASENNSDVEEDLKCEPLIAGLNPQLDQATLEGSVVISDGPASELEELANVETVASGSDMIVAASEANAPAVTDISVADAVLEAKFVSSEVEELDMSRTTCEEVEAELPDSQMVSLELVADAKSNTGIASVEGEGLTSDTLESAVLEPTVTTEDAGSESDLPESKETSESMQNATQENEDLEAASPHLAGSESASIDVAIVDLNQPPQSEQTPPICDTDATDAANVSEPDATEDATISAENTKIESEPGAQDSIPTVQTLATENDSEDEICGNSDDVVANDPTALTSDPCLESTSSNASTDGESTDCDEATAPVVDDNTAMSDSPLAANVEDAHNASLLQEV